MHRFAACGGTTAGGMMTLGSGTHRYEWIEGWAKLPAGIKLGYTHGAVTDRNDNVYIFNQSRDAVLVFDRDGNFIRSWGEQFAAGAHGMFLSEENGDEYLYLVDYEIPQIARTSLDGGVLFTISTPDRTDLYNESKKYKPTFACPAPDGGFYVFDGYGQNWIHRYDRDARYIRSFGGTGSEPGQLKCPHAGYIDTRSGEPILYVADRGNKRIQKLTPDGEHIGFVTDEMDMPCMFFEHQGELYIPDLHSRLTILDRNDRLIAHLGENPEAWQTKGWPNIQDRLQPGRFNSPHACCVDSHGDVYMVEWISTGRITKLRRQT
jgi:hypothetical protein